MLISSKNRTQNTFRKWRVGSISIAFNVGKFQVAIICRLLWLMSAIVKFYWKLLTRSAKHFYSLFDLRGWHMSIKLEKPEPTNHRYLKLVYRHKLSGCSVLIYRWLLRENILCEYYDTERADSREMKCNTTEIYKLQERSDKSVILISFKHVDSEKRLRISYWNILETFIWIILCSRNRLELNLI